MTMQTGIVFMAHFVLSLKKNIQDDKRVIQIIEDNVQMVEKMFFEKKQVDNTTSKRKEYLKSYAKGYARGKRTSKLENSHEEVVH